MGVTETKSPHYVHEAIRRRAKLRLYIGNGIKQLFHSLPIGLFALLLLVTAFVATWKVADIIAPEMTSLPAIIVAIKWLARIVFFVLIALVAIGFLYLFGAPRKAREIENDIATAFSIPAECLHLRPFLVSQKPVKGTTATEYIFWSRWIPLEKWNKPDEKKAVLWALYAYSDEDFKVGEQKYTVTITAAPGVIPKEREAPKDPLFM